MPFSDRTVATLFFVAAVLWAVLAFTVLKSPIMALLSVLLAGGGVVFLTRKQNEH